MNTTAQVFGLGLAAAAAVGVAMGWAGLAALARHLRGPRRRPTVRPPISILKPLCGLDDRLAANLRSFAALPYPDYEVLLGVRDPDDPALRVARDAARQFPLRFRIVLQESEPGMNPKVNQLLTLARRARHNLLVISDSNTRVPPGYLDEIAAELEDPAVGLVTHPLVGDGETLPGGRWGAVADNLHLSGVITPSIVTAKVVFGKDYVVGKSMAMRRADLEALGGFASVKDVLAEDFVLGRAVTDRLGKRIALARAAVTCISERRSLAGFLHRYARWNVMQHQCAGLLGYLGLLLLNPMLLASLATLVDPSAKTALVLGLCAGSRIGIDAFASRLLRSRSFCAAALLGAPFKDLLAGAAWVYGLFSRSIEWRSNRLLVLRGSHLRLRHPAGQTPRGSDKALASADA